MAQYISSGLWCKCAAKRAHMHSPHLAHIDKRMHAFFFLIEMCEDWGGLSVAVYRNHSCFTLCSVWTSLWLLYSCTAVHYIHSAYGDAMHVQCRTNGALCVPFDECANSFCWKFSSSFICFRVIYIKPDFFLVYFFFFAVFWPKFCVMCGHIAEKRLLLFGPRAWRSFRVAEHFFYSFLRVSLSRAVMEEHAQHPQMHLGIVGIEGCGPWIFLYFSKVSRSRCLIVLIFCIFEGSWPSQSVIRGIRKCRETVSAVKL